jgi:serralysin
MSAMPWPVGTAKFLDKRPLDEADPAVNALLEVLIRAYDEEYEALAVAGQVGLHRADIEILPKLRFTWWSIVREATGEGQLRRLVDVTLRDPTIVPWHAKIREIVQAPEGMLVVGAQPPEPTSKRGRRDRALKPVMGDKAQLWKPGMTLRVRFLGGAQSLQKKVEASAHQGLDYANLRFAFGKDPNAEVRIAFEPNDGSWSYVGTQALELPKDQPTVNFSWFTKDSPPEEIDRVVLHEMGHVLGLMHEHSNPASTLKWDRKKIYESFAGAPNFWDRAAVDANIFAVWPPKFFPIRKIFDPESIMMFPQSPEFFTDGVEIGWNKTISPIDKQFVAGLYPE